MTTANSRMAFSRPCPTHAALTTTTMRTTTQVGTRTSALKKRSRTTPTTKGATIKMVICRYHVTYILKRMIFKTIRVTLSITIYPAMEGFVEAEAGYRFYAAGQPGEWRIDLTMGLRPWP